MISAAVRLLPRSIPITVSPCSLVGNSLFPKSGNTQGGAPKSGPFTEAATPGSPDFGVCPCTFPANQGYAPETSSLQTARSASLPTAVCADTGRPSTGQPQAPRAVGRPGADAGIEPATASKNISNFRRLATPSGAQTHTRLTVVHSSELDVLVGTPTKEPSDEGFGLGAWT